MYKSFLYVGITKEKFPRVLVVRGRSRWWGLAAIVGYGIGVLDWELAVLAPGAAALWVLLFRSRVTTLSLAGVLKRTWWIWASLAVIAIAWLVNFVQHYYSPSGRADLGEYLQAFWIAVGRTTLPTILGFHDPGLVWFSNVGTALAGLVVLVLVVHTARTRVGAWRGWLFGFAAWLLPIAALLLNRVADYGPGVATHLLYYFLPVTLVIVGALEVWRAPRRAVARGRMPLTVPGRRILALVTVAVLVVGVAAYARSASRVAVGYTVGYSGFTTRLADSARGRSEQGAFSVIDSNVVNVPAKFHPYNRLDRIADVVGVPLNFDGVNPPYAVVDRFGQLHDAQITWVDTELVESSTAGGFQILGMRDLTFVPGEGACFTTVDQFSQVVWPLASPISSDHLVVRAPLRVDTPVEQRLYVAPAVGQDYLPANEDPGKSWQPGSEGTLDTVTSSTIGASGASSSASMPLTSTRASMSS